MASSPKIYTRLPGVGSSGFQRCRLWLAEDHMLQVASTAVGERYRRFYFADIQALVVHRTSTWIVWSIVWLLCAALVAALTTAVDEPAGKITFSSIAAFFLALFVVNLALGPSCSCTVRTAVQSEPLPSIKRLRAARKIFGRVRPLIEAAQSATQPAQSSAQTTP